MFERAECHNHYKWFRQPTPSPASDPPPRFTRAREKEKGGGGEERKGNERRRKNWAKLVRPRAGARGPRVTSRPSQGIEPQPPGLKTPHKVNGPDTGGGVQKGVKITEEGKEVRMKKYEVKV